MGESGTSVLLNGWGGLGGTGIVDSLRHNTDGRALRIVCADIEHRPALEYAADAFSILPHGDDPAYVDALLRLCRREGIDVILPGSSPEIRAISKNVERIRAGGVRVALDDYARIRPMMSKAQTYRTLRNGGIPVPDFAHVTDASQILPAVADMGYPDRPVCFKPSSYESSGGARGFRVLRRTNTPFTAIFGESAAEIDYDSVRRLSGTKERLDLLVMEYLPGPEFSVYVLADKGQMLYCVPNLRERMVGVHTFEASTVPADSGIRGICERIVGELGLSYNVNIQLKASESGELKLVEINPRMGGSIILPVAAGINLPYMAVKMALGERVRRDATYSKIRMVRRVSEMFADSDGMWEISQGPRQIS